MPEPRPSVFIGSSTEGHDVALAIQSNLDRACEVVLWSQGVFGLNRGTLETLAEAIDTYDFAVLVVTPDDMTTSREQTKNAPRDNVLLELGMFIGGLGKDRTFFVVDRSKPIKLPSDLAGVTFADYEPHSSGNLEAALGAATTKIQKAITTTRRRIRSSENEAVLRDKEFQTLHSFMDVSSEQYLILMHQTPRVLQRERQPFERGGQYTYWNRTESGGHGLFTVDALCRKLADVDIITVNLRDEVSLTNKGRAFAEWLLERGHKVDCFRCDFGGWGDIPANAPPGYFSDLLKQVGVPGGPGKGTITAVGINPR